MRGSLIGLIGAADLAACGAEPAPDRAEPHAAATETVGSTDRITITPAAPAIVLLTDAAEPVRLGVGQRFGVVLRENGSIGETWEVADHSGPARYEGKSVYDPYQATPRGGAYPVDLLFSYVATGKGDVTLRFTSVFRGRKGYVRSYRAVID